MKMATSSGKSTLQVILLLLACYTFSFSQLYATTYYVNSSGSNNNNGLTPSTAWKTITKVNAFKIKPGDKVLFAGGQTFIGNLYLDSSDANDSLNLVTISSYGTGRAIINAANDYGIYVYNTQGLTISNLIIEGAGMDVNTADGVSVYTDLDGDVKLRNITIKNIEVRDFGKSGISIGSWNKNSGFNNLLVDSSEVHHVKENGITFWGYTSQTHVGWAHQNVTLRNSYVHDVTGYSSTSHKGSGIIMGQVDLGLIDRCVAHNNGTANTHCGGPGGIWVWDSNSVTIQHCESHHNSKGTGCDGFGFDLDGGVTNSVMQYNYSHNNDGAGYFLGQYAYARPWNNNTVRYNISENDARGNAAAIAIFKGPGTTMSGLKVYQNTIYVTPSTLNTTAAAFTIKKWNTGINGVAVYNNIFQTTGGIPLISIPAGYSAYFAGNLYWTSGSSFKIKYQGVTYYNLANWQTASNNEKVGSTATGIVANPLLINAGKGETIFPSATEFLKAYSLSNTSPAINAGLNLTKLFNVNSGEDDFFDNALNNGTNADVGAYESSTTTASREQINSEETSTEGNGSFSLFPNPVHNDSLVRLMNIDDTVSYSVELISIRGEVQWKSEFVNQHALDIPIKNLGAGLYLIRIVDAAGNITNRKLLIE
jgi:hypothetical protein